MRPITVFTVPSITGKQLELYGRRWEPITLTTAEELIDWKYIQGHPILPAQLSEGRRVSESWLSMDVIPVDLDDLPPHTTIADLLLSDFLRRHALAIMPSSSWSAAVPKYHAFLAMSRGVATETARHNILAWTYGHIPFKLDRAFIKIPVHVLAGTRFTLIDAVPARGDGRYYVNDAAEPIDVHAALTEVIVRQLRGEPLDGYAAIQLIQQHAKHPVISRRAALHAVQEHNRQVDVALEALSFALIGWGWRTYDEWLGLWLSAYDGTGGDMRAAQMIATHPDMRWDDSTRRDRFLEGWRRHKPRSDGYTVATLFMLARQNGWLQTSSEDINDDDCTLIDTDDLTAWMAAQPIDALRRALIVSGTGSGKTQAAIAHYKRLGLDKKAVFIAPSIKLCESLSATLTAAGVPNELYRNSTKTKDAKHLQEAKCLVTTLQTFAVKVFSGSFDISEYYFVAIDESDELLSAFVRSGSTLLTYSHVSEQQALAGMTALSRLLQTVHTVMMLDGTATKLSQRFLEYASPPSLVRIYRNEWKRQKADVLLVDNARLSELVIEALKAGERVAVACDTKKAAKEFDELLRREVDGLNMLTVYGDVAKSDALTAFFKDVNTESLKYQCIVYNSAMGSGVSITAPVDLVAVHTSYLAPRKIVQLANRFRRQGRMVLYCQPRENLYHEDAEVIFERRKNNLRSWAAVLKVAVAQQSEVAVNIEQLARIAIQDDLQQHRSKRDFLIGQLERDGRRVLNSDIQGDAPAHVERMKPVREALAEEHEDVLRMWRDVEPLAQGDSAPEGYDEKHIRAARLHALIEQTLDTDGLRRAADRDAEYVAQAVQRFASRMSLWRAFNEPSRAVAQTIADAQNSDAVAQRLKTTMTHLDLLSTVALMFHSFDEALTPQAVAARAPDFIDAVRLRQDMYDDIIHDRQAKFEAVMQQPTPSKQAEHLARAILRRFGLSTARVRGHVVRGQTPERLLTVKHVSELTDFLSWVDVPPPTVFDGARLNDAVHSAQAAIARYNFMSATAKQRVQVNVKEGMTFEDAVALVGGL